MKRTKYLSAGMVLVCLFMLLSCYKEDVSTLYGRQYELTAELNGISSEVLRINNEIIDLRKLYILLKNREVVTGFEYKVIEQNGIRDTLGVTIFIDGKEFFIPFGRDGKTPVVSISSDGYWVINGKKTEVKAKGEKGDKGEQGAQGEKGENGHTPVITISPDGYWIIDGEKTNTKAKGEKGDKGEQGAQGEKGENGHTPVITISPDGFWVIDGAKTNTKAKGEKGDKGEQGAQGEKGENGHTPVITIGPDGCWEIDGVSSGVMATGPQGEKGENGHTPIITISSDGYWVIDGEKTTTKARGEKGDIQVIGISSDGYWMIDGVKTEVLARGPKGEKGENGHTPAITISSDGYWVIDGAKTVVKAIGEKGDKGEQGAQGEKGENGHTPVITISPDGYWVIDGAKTNTKARGEKGDKGEQGAQGEKGENGHTPVITISSDGYWVIDGAKTNTKAKGEKGDKGEQGVQGEKGENGHTPVITISPDGYWVIDGEKTSVKAKGEDGEKGKDGSVPTITISPDGYWIINGKKTEWKAIGVDGEDGRPGADGKPGSTPKIEIENGYWIINDVNTGIAATGPKGEKGENGHTPVISISPDGYWIIDGTKSSSKAVPDDGKTPLISAARDTENPSDENYYWTIKYPGESEYKFILVNGQKLKATGPKGDKGQDGVTPVVEPVIESVVKGKDGTSIVINLHDGTSYIIPLKSIQFKLMTEGKLTSNEDGTESYIEFDSQGQVIDIPYIASDNVKRIEAILPVGWSAMADISADPSKRIIHVSAPTMIDISSCQNEGTATFIAFDQEGAAITQYVKLKLGKQTFMSFFYNQRNNIETNRPNSPFNQLKYTENHKLVVNFFKLINRDFKYYGGYSPEGPLNTEFLLKYPSIPFIKNERDVGEQFKVNVFLYNPNGVFQGAVVGRSEPEYQLYAPYEYTSSDGKTYMKPVPFDTYMVQHSYTANNTNNNEIVRLRRAACQVNVSIAKVSEFLGIPKEDFDESKLAMTLNSQVQYLFASFEQYGNTTYAALGDKMHYDKDTDRLICSFATLGSRSSSCILKIFYDREGKKSWEMSNGHLAGPDWYFDIYLNEEREPFEGAGSLFKDYAGYNDRTVGQTYYRRGSVRDLEETLPDLQ